MRENNVSDGS